MVCYYKITAKENNKKGGDQKMVICIGMVVVLGGFAIAAYVL